MYDIENSKLTGHHMTTLQPCQFQVCFLFCCWHTMTQAYSKQETVRRSEKSQHTSSFISNLISVPNSIVTLRPFKLNQFCIFLVSPITRPPLHLTPHQSQLLPRIFNDRMNPERTNASCLIQQRSQRDDGEGKTKKISPPPQHTNLYTQSFNRPQTKMWGSR